MVAGPRIELGNHGYEPRILPLNYPALDFNMTTAGNYDIPTLSV